MQIPLTGGFYKAKSVIASAQRCLNLFPEKNPPDAPFPYTHYLTPGLSTVHQGPVGPVRGLYTASDGTLWVAIGNTVYWADAGFNLTSVGTLSTSSGPVVMQDNRLVLVVVDGSTTGWWISMSTKVMSQIVDPAFYGANRVDLLDTFFIFDRPNSNQWYISPSEWDGLIAFDSLDVVAMSGSNDGLSSLMVVNRQIWLLGDGDYGEIWYNVGTPDFTFGRVPGVAIQHGASAPWSVARWDLMLIWLGKDAAGQQQVFMGANYQAKVISTMAISAAITGYANVSDAIGFIYQENGHVFYVLTFPSADRTWVYDLTENLWHERAWIDSNGEEHRIRANCQAFAYGKQIVGDWENGKLYEMSTAFFNDAGQPIVRRRGFPHITNKRKRLSVSQFVANMAVGQMPGGTSEDPPMVSLRASTAQGASWGNPRTQSLGGTGQYGADMQWRQFGLGRDWVFELFWDCDCETALNGAYMEAEAAET